MIASNPFTPQSGWEPRVFGGREQNLSLFKSNLDDAISVRPNHLVVLGEWGIGKTSLLKQFKRIVQEQGHPACFCSISRFTKKDRPLDAMYLIAEEMLMGLPKSGIDSEEFLSAFSRRKSLAATVGSFNWCSFPGKCNSKASIPSKRSCANPPALRSADRPSMSDRRPGLSGKNQAESPSGRDPTRLPDEGE